MAQVPNHPIITEIFNDPSGNDGPTGRMLDNPDQEFIELYVPTAGSLDASLNKDAINLTLYELEGDSTSSQRGQVNQRFDLPPIDLDPNNGITFGAMARPTSGVIVLGWVDYDGAAPPAALGGTPSTRIGLIQNGIEASPSGVLFIALNGNQFGGTTNFPTPLAESLVDVPRENESGVCRNGSNVYLLVNRDDPGYVRLEDRSHPELGASDPSLPSGLVLRTNALLDGFAGNDDPMFAVADQPLPSPSGLNIDLEDVLPAGGAFSLLIPQVPEGSGGGYARRYVDVLKTTEDAVPGNEDPAIDAVNHYREVHRSGPFFATPGAIVFTFSPPRLGVARLQRLQFEVLAGTTGRPGLLCANVGGDSPIDIVAIPGVASNPAIATLASDEPARDIGGQTEAFPRVSAAVPLSAPNGSIVTAAVTFTASNSVVTDPSVQNASEASTLQLTVVRPSTGLSQFDTPYQTTVFAAIQGFGADPQVANELRESDLGLFARASLGRQVLVALGNGDTLLAPETDLESVTTVDPLRRTFPTSEAEFINAPGPAGRLSLVDTLITSPKNIVSPTTYASSLDAARARLRAYEIDLPETLTANGSFTPHEELFFLNALGGEFDVRSGFAYANTTRTFELALIDSNTTSTGIEHGGLDDFGLIVEVGRTRPGAQVVPGEFVFLSYMGGLVGEDIDGVDIPGANATDAILLDLDNLDIVLGCETITRVFVVDASAPGTINIIEAFSLNPLCASSGSCPYFGDSDRNGRVNLDDVRVLSDCLLGPSSEVDGLCAIFDMDQENDVDLMDAAHFQRDFDGP